MGGDGSGRKPDVIKSMINQQNRSAGIVNAGGDELVLPNYSGLQAVKKTDPTISASGHTIQDEGTPLTNRSNLNFSGAGVSVVDDSGNDSTIVNITATGGGDNLGNHIATQTLSGAAIYMTGAFTGGGSGHDQFSDFVAAEHVNWAAASAGTIHASNYVDNDTTYVSSDFDHNSLTNNHNLTTDINHDALTNFAANEHFTEASIDHTAITNIGTNSHAAIDSELTSVSGATVSNASNISTNTTVISDLSGAYYTHAADTSDPHGATITQTNATITNLSGASIVRTGDVSTSGAAYVPNVIFGTSSGAHTASNYTLGTIMFIYTA